MTTHDDPFSAPPKTDNGSHAAGSAAGEQTFQTGIPLKVGHTSTEQAAAAQDTTSQTVNPLLSVLDACVEASSSAKGEPSFAAFNEGDLVKISNEFNQNSLYTAAISLFGIINQMRNSWILIDVADLRQRMIGAVSFFEQRALAAGYSEAVVHTAHYCLCTAIDEAALSTEWGSNSAWPRQTLLFTFYNETAGGETFFTKLDQVKAWLENRADHVNVSAEVDLLEIFYVCLALGFHGKYRVLEQGPARLNEQRRAVYLLVQQYRAAIEDELSPSWRTTEAVNNRRRYFLPAWLTILITLVLLLGIYITMSHYLNQRSDLAFASVQSIGRVAAFKLERTASIVEKAPQRTGWTVAKVEPVRRAPMVEKAPAWWHGFDSFLEDEVRRNILEVIDRKDAIIIRVFNKGLFPSASATVSDIYQGVFRRIGNAIKAKMPGAVTVIGHSDNRPLRNSIRFPSNWHLSTARAEAVAKAILPSLSDPSRISFEGRSDTEPLANNATPEGRAANRRVEIYLPKLVPIADTMPVPPDSGGVIPEVWKTEVAPLRE